MGNEEIYAVGPVEEGLGSGTPLDNYQLFDVATPPSMPKYDKSEGRDV